MTDMSAYASMPFILALALVRNTVKPINRLSCAFSVINSFGLLVGLSLIVVTSHIDFSHLLPPFPCMQYAISPYQHYYVAAHSTTGLSVCHFNLLECFSSTPSAERRPHRILGISYKITFACSPLKNTIQSRNNKSEYKHVIMNGVHSSLRSIGYVASPMRPETRAGHPTSTQTGSWPYTTSCDSDFILVSVTDRFLSTL